MLVSFSGEVSETEVPPLLFARWWVGVAGGGVTVTWVLVTWADARWAGVTAVGKWEDGVVRWLTGDDIPAKNSFITNLYEFWFELFFLIWQETCHIILTAFILLILTVSIRWGTVEHNGTRRPRRPGRRVDTQIAVSASSWGTSSSVVSSFKNIFKYVSVWVFRGTYL